MVWDTNAFPVVFFVVFISREIKCMISLLNGIQQSGWVPFAISMSLLIIILPCKYERNKNINMLQRER
jgi:K+ transporter